MWKRLVKCALRFPIIPLLLLTLTQTQRCLDGVSRQRYELRAVYAKPSIELFLVTIETLFVLCVHRVTTQALAVLFGVPMIPTVARMVSAS
mmetsp:Transcript_5692/g.16485  ORF Transcript_5692/g.16485 Transcript_5692/m.16485 type:complete len:91 (+) Transcript_5692:1708-1980(+)